MADTELTAEEVMELLRATVFKKHTTIASWADSTGVSRKTLPNVYTAFNGKRPPSNAVCSLIGVRKVRASKYFVKGK